MKTGGMRMNERKIRNIFLELVMQSGRWKGKQVLAKHRDGSVRNAMGASCQRPQNT